MTVSYVWSDAEIGLVSLFDSATQSVSWVYSLTQRFQGWVILLTTVCPREWKKATLWVDFLYMNLRSETGEGGAIGKVFRRTANWTGIQLRYPASHRFTLQGVLNLWFEYSVSCILYRLVLNIYINSVSHRVKSLGTDSISFVVPPNTVFRNILPNEEGFINTPNYPGEYPSGKTLYWLLTTTEGKRIRLEFATFELSLDDSLEVGNLVT